jgi:hypothetical protein
VYTTISLAEKSLLLANCSFAKVFATPKLAALRHLGRLQVKNNATAHPKIGSLKKIIWQLRAAKVQQCCGKTSPHVGRAWRRSSLLVAAIVISS